MIGFAATSVADVVFQWIACRRLGQPLTWEKYDGLRTFRNGAIGGLFGAGIAYGAYQDILLLEEQQCFCSDRYLKQVLNRENLRENPELYQFMVGLRSEIKQWLWCVFQDELVVHPEDTSSLKKRTAISSTADLDITLAFRRNCSKTLEEIYSEVYQRVGERFRGIATVTRQRRTVGIDINHRELQVHLDIVPGREINDYKKDRELKLFVRPNWILGNSTHTKTNTRTQRNSAVNNQLARSIIKLLKKYSYMNDLGIPSIIIEEYTVAAFTYKSLSASRPLTENLLNVMHYMSRKITQNTLIDSANSSNNLHSKLGYRQRQRIATLLATDIDQIESNHRYIKELFE